MFPVMGSGFHCFLADTPKNTASLPGRIIAVSLGAKLFSAAVRTAGIFYDFFMV
jgi:hypothetical protein